MIFIACNFVPVLQSLNQRPNQAMAMQGMQNKMTGMGMMASQVGGPMGHMTPIQGMQNNAMLNQINQVGQVNLAQQMSHIPPNQMAQMNPTQMTTGQMQQNMQVLPTAHF